MSAAPARFASDGRGHDTSNCMGVTKEAAMEKLGVIGGMGAEATSYYYDQVVRHTAATCDQEHIDSIAEVLFGIGMHCLGCPSSQMETIEQAAMVHGIEPQELVDRLNDVVA